MAKNYKAKLFRNRMVATYGDNLKHAKVTNRFINQVIDGSVPVDIQLLTEDLSIVRPSSGTVTVQFEAIVLPENAPQGVSFFFGNLGSGMGLIPDGMTLSSSGLLTVGVDAIARQYPIRMSTNSGLSKEFQFEVIQTPSTEVVIVSDIVDIGQTLYLNGYTLPENSNSSLTWELVNPVEGLEFIENQLIIAEDFDITKTALVKATSYFTPTVFAEKVISFKKPTPYEITLTPTNIAITQPTTGTKTQQFTTAFVPTFANNSVTWALSKTVVGASVNTSGLLTVSNTSPLGSFDVTATSTLNNEVIGVATINITQPIATGVTLSPTTGNTMIQPTTGTLTKQFTASIVPANAPQGITWTLSKAVAGVSISTSGLLTISNTSPVDTFNVVATSTATGTVKSETAVNIALPVATGVTLSPMTHNMIQPTTGNITHQFTASIVPTNAPQGITWSLNKVVAGASVNASGLLTIGATTPAGTFNVVATSTATGAVKSESVITVALPVATSVTLSPMTYNITAPETDPITQQFTASIVPANAPQGITWTMSKVVPNVTLSATGLLTISAGALTDTFNVVATSTATGAVKSESVVTLTAFGA